MSLHTSNILVSIIYSHGVVAIKMPTVSSDSPDTESEGAAMECLARLARKKAATERKLVICILAMGDDNSLS